MKNFMKSLVTVSRKEYRSWDTIQKKKYWEWRKKALLLDKKEITTLGFKIYRFKNSKKYKYVKSISSSENNFIKILERMIKNIQKRKINRVKHTLVMVETK